ncbi:MAG: sodium:solute symporter [Acidobacteriota bacterium]|nr:sodium:solute symporter [Acidobacteriota bacterium]
MRFDTLDWVVVSVYFAGLLGIAAWVAQKRQSTAADYFLAGRHVGWFAIGASLFASNIGSEHVVGLAGSGASTGIVLGHYELHSWLILLLGWVFVPFYLRSGVFTMPEFLERRYDRRSRWFLSVVMLVGYVLTKVSVTVYAGGVMLQGLMGLDFWTGAAVVVLLTGAYTVLGGLRAVVYTETLQAFVLVGGSVAVTGFGLVEIGGWQELRRSVDPELFDLWKPLDDPDFPWLGMVLTPPIVGLWYWCTDQYIVQRVLAAADVPTARRGAIWGAYLKLSAVFLFIVPGIVALGLANRGQLSLAEADQALPVLVSTVLPVGLRGLVAAGLLAALMSSLAAVFNSCSTLFTMDFYKLLHPDASDTQLVQVGRLGTGVVVVLGIAWIPVMRLLSTELYTYLQNVQAYIAPPIAAVFLLGLLWRRVNATGAICTLVTGFGLGMTKLILELQADAVSGPLAWLAGVNFLYFGFALFLVCVTILCLVSVWSERPDPTRLVGLTLGTWTSERTVPAERSWTRMDVAHSVLIVALILAVMTYFTG